MARCMRFDTQDRAVLAALDNDFKISIDGETATVTGEMKLTVVRLADDGADRLWLTLTVENGGVLVQCTPTFIGSSKNYKSRQLKSSLQLITGAIPQKNQALGTLVSPQNA